VVDANASNCRSKIVRAGSPRKVVGNQIVNVIGRLGTGVAVGVRERVLGTVEGGAGVALGVGGVSVGLELHPISSANPMAAIEATTNRGRWNTLTVSDVL
jgi:hypothetical protein